MKRIISAVLVCILMVGCVFALASCGGPNKDPKKAAKALEDAEYTVNLVDGEAAKTLKCEAMISAYNKDGETITIMYYLEAADAKEAYNEAKDALKELEEAAKEADEEFNYEVGKSGKMVWMGTKDAIKAAK